MDEHVFLLFGLVLEKHPVTFQEINLRNQEMLSSSIMGNVESRDFVSGTITIQEYFLL